MTGEIGQLSLALALALSCVMAIAGLAGANARYAQARAVARSASLGFTVFVALRGEPYVLWRAVDEQGVELDILLQRKRDTPAANDSSSVCFVRARCRARSSLTSCAVIRPRSPESPSWQTSGTCSSRLQPA